MYIIGQGHSLAFNQGLSYFDSFKKDCSNDAECESFMVVKIFKSFFLRKAF